MRSFLLPTLVVLAGCTQFETSPPDAPEKPVETTAPPPPANARTVEEFDTTSEAEREAAASTGSGGRLLGETVASLGDPGLPGFWMMTSLVQSETPGRLDYPAGGTSVEVTLIPTEGASARVSLAALRLLNAPLADLSTLEVYAR